MPYVVTCPKCKTKLKSNDPVPAGRSVTCLKCKTMFTLMKPAPELEAPAKPAPSADRVDRPARPRDDDDDDRPRRRKDDDEEEDRPRSRRRDDDDRPRGKRPPDDDEEGDLPRGKRRRDEDDADDDRPRSRNRAADDDDADDRPRSHRGRDEDDDPPAYPGKRRRDEDDEDDDRPRSRKGRKKSRKALFLILGAAAAMLFLLGAGGLAVWYFDPFGLFGGASSEMLAWVPSDSQAIMYVDVEAMDKVNELKSTFKGEPVDQVKLGLKPEDVSAVLGAGKDVGDEAVSVIKLRSKADQQKLISSCGGKEATANGKKYYKSSGGGALYFAADKLLVVTKNEATMTALLQKDKKVTISDDLKSAANKGDGIIWMAATGSAAEHGDMVGMMSGLANALANMMGGPGAKSQPKAKGTLMSMKVSGSKATVRFESTYDSSDTAKKVADDLKKAMDMAKSKSKDLESFDVSTSGSTVTLAITGPVKSGKGGLPGLPFGPGGGF
jgi:hypothetical protein